MIKQPGLCTCCDRECFEIRERFADDHVYGGATRRVGKMLECGTQLEFLLSDGSLMPLAMCIDCAIGLTPEQYPAIMKKVIDAWEQSLDDTHRIRIGAKPWDDKTMTKDSYRRHYYNLWIVGKMWARRFEHAKGPERLDRRIKS